MLPRIDVTAWAGHDLVHRRAAVLAHYYSLRAAGWIDGMLALRRRRNRAECSARCTDLVDAAAALLDPDDPLRDQVTAYGLGYRQQHSATFGHGAPGYADLLATLTRMHGRIRPGRPGRAELWETLQLVLRELNTVRRAAGFGLHAEPSAATVTRDVEQWPTRRSPG